MRKNDKRLLAALLVLVPGFVFAQTEDAERTGAPVQVAQAGDPAVAEFDELLKETEGLEVYNALLQRQLDAQQVEVQNLRASIEDVPELERQLPPLLITMVQGLEEFVRLDLPFLPEERAERVAQLQLLVERADVSDTEKFRRILEAWQIETEYGNGYSTYVDEVEIDGEPREVEIFQLGRVGLYYQTTDEAAITAAYDQRSGEWVRLGSEHRNSVRRALQMARNQIAPELVLLPVIPASQ